MKDPKTPNPKLDKAVDEAAVFILERQLSDLFLKAVKEHDAKTIIEIANAAWYFKDKFGRGSGEVKPEGDAERHAILLMKSMVELTGAVPTVQEAAGFVEYMGGVKVGDESLFRKKCRKLGLKIQRSGKIMGI